MKFATSTAAFALVAGVFAGEHHSGHHSSATAASNVTYTTEVVTAFTTFCPSATTLTHLGSTITVTAPTTVTFTNCPCTVTKPVHSSSSVFCPSSLTGAPIPIITSGAASPTGGHHHHTSASGSPVPYGNSTTPAVPPKTSVTAVTSSSAPIATGAADRNVASSGAGLAAALGFAAYFL